MKGVALQQEATLLTGAVFVAVLLLGGPVYTPAQPLDLDANPTFDFGDDASADPLFTPQLLGLTNGLAGYDHAAAVSALAAAAHERFPPSHEVFLAYWGNPTYALVPEGAPAAGPLAAGSPLSLASAFRGLGVEANVVPVRTAGWSYGGPTETILAGLLFQLPGACSYVSPLVLDLNGDGQLSASRGLWRPHPSKLTGPYAAFDMDGDGFKDATEWIGVGDGLLVTSTNPTSGHDLVGTAGGWPDGFAHLAAVFDLDHNGRVEGAELEGLYVWQDANTNGVADPGEVVPAASLGIAWIAATNSGDYSSTFHLTGADWDWRVYDWWPNYALANRRSASPASGGHPLLGLDAVAPIRNILFGRVIDDNNPPRTSGLIEPRHIPPEQLASAGIDLTSFRMALLADAGKVIIGYDTLTSSNGPGRARLLEYVADRDKILTVELPFEQVFQLASDTRGNVVLVLGDHGSKLALVDFVTQTVTPPGGLDLGAVGLRASGVAGQGWGSPSPAIITKDWSNTLEWFTAWQLDAQGAVVDERVWALTPWGFWGGLSLDALRNEIGPLRQHYITGPQSGFFVAPTLGGTNETLWWINGSCSDTCRVAVAQADSFGGMHALAAGKVKWFNKTSGTDAGPATVVLYVKRDGATYSADWWSAGKTEVLATNSEPYFYPFLTEGDTALQAQLDTVTGTITYWVATNAAAAAPGHAHVTPLLTTCPGQGKVSRGAFAHYGTNGIDIIPVPDAPAPTPLSQVWQYTLLSSGQLTDNCSACGRPTIIAPMQGTFRLRLLDDNPLFSTYAIDNLSFTAGATNGANYKVAGQGVYQVGGEVGLLQNMFLAAYIDDGQTNRLCYFTNVATAVTRWWPMIQITLAQTNGTPLQTYTLDLNAAPLREIWFSTTTNFYAGIWSASTNFVSSGDLLSTAGHIVKRNQDLTSRLGIMPAVPDLGLDAVDVLPHGEIAFSVEQDILSEMLGLLHEGDVLSDRGRVVTNYAALIGAFGPEPPPTDQGLDALQVLDSGEIYFSVERDFFPETLGRPVRRGDLLSSAGQIVKTNEQLLARFHPALSNGDYGLDALQVWPSGEIWFSTEDGFQDQALGAIQPGDLLSDQGYVVYRNHDLLAAFAPVENLTDFGLDALFVVSDASPPTSTVAAPRLTGVTLEPSTGNVSFQWDGAGRVFQLEKATNVLGPWLPLGPVLTEPPVVDLGALTNSPQGFYRLRQW